MGGRYGVTLVGGGMGGRYGVTLVGGGMGGTPHPRGVWGCGGVDGWGGPGDIGDLSPSPGGGQGKEGGLIWVGGDTQYNSPNIIAHYLFMAQLAALLFPFRCVRLWCP